VVEHVLATEGRSVSMSKVERAFGLFSEVLVGTNQARLEAMSCSTALRAWGCLEEIYLVNGGYDEASPVRSWTGAPTLACSEDLTIFFFYPEGVETEKQKSSKAMLLATDGDGAFFAINDPFNQIDGVYIANIGVGGELSETILMSQTPGLVRDAVTLAVATRARSEGVGHLDTRTGQPNTLSVAEVMGEIEEVAFARIYRSK